MFCKPSPELVSPLSVVVVVDEEAVDVVTDVVLDRTSVAGGIMLDCVVLVTTLVSVDDGCSQSGSLVSHAPSKLQVTTAVFEPGHLNSNSLPFRLEL